MSMIARLRKRVIRAARLERVSRRAKRWDRVRHWRAVKERASARYARAKAAAARARRGNFLWGGCRQVTNEVVAIVDGRAPVTSRKRTQTYGNPGSDHHVSQRQADAVDFGVANAHWLKDEISRRLGGPSKLADYGNFVVRRNGRAFRVQIIAGTHGTGPHLHVGVRRI